MYLFICLVCVIKHKITNNHAFEYCLLPFSLKELEAFYNMTWELDLFITWLQILRQLELLFSPWLFRRFLCIFSYSLFYFYLEDNQKFFPIFLLLLMQDMSLGLVLIIFVLPRSTGLHLYLELRLQSQFLRKPLHYQPN